MNNRKAIDRTAYAAGMHYSAYKAACVYSRTDYGTHVSQIIETEQGDTLSLLIEKLSLKAVHVVVLQEADKGGLSCH